MNTPKVWKLEDLFAYLVSDENQTGMRFESGQTIWFPARPLARQSLGARFRAAWLVFTGRADAVEWPFQ